MDILPVLASAITAFAATLSAGILVKRYKRNIGVVCAFAAGVLVALAIFDMLPDIIVLAPRVQVSFEMSAFTILAGFFSLYALDKGLFQIGKKSRKSSTRTIGLLSALEFCFHGFLEGLAIGISFQFELGLGILVTFAVVSHDFCDGLSTLALMLNSGNTMRSSMSMLFLDAIAPVLGAIATLFFHVQGYFIVLGFSFLAGSFVYLGLGSLLPEARRKNRQQITFIFFFMGFIMILLLSMIMNAWSAR